MRVLIVDDEAHLRRMMRITLETAGYDVEDAADGEAGLRAFADGAVFDAVLLDQRMPGLDGLETLRRMKATRADACVIMVTAYATIELAVDALKLGATDFVRKPMTPETLRQAVAAALSKRVAVTIPAPPLGPLPAPAGIPQSPDLSPAEVWTTNGFFLRRVRLDVASHTSSEHKFVVRRGADEARNEVVVSIDPKAIAKLARECRREFAPGGAYWTDQAERALVNYLWSEAKLPENGRLIVTAVTGRMIDEAMSWEGD
jgi:DNA-binding response OmpR family regulator